jgi:hypothetical protein
MRIALEPNAAQSEPRKRAFIYRALEIVQVQPPRFLEADRRRSRTSPPRSALTLRLLLRVTRAVAADPQCVGAAQSMDGGHSCLWPFSTTAMGGGDGRGSAFGRGSRCAACLSSARRRRSRSAPGPAYGPGLASSWLTGVPGLQRALASCRCSRAGAHVFSVVLEPTRFPPHGSTGPTFRARRSQPARLRIFTVRSPTGRQPAGTLAMNARRRARPLACEFHAHTTGATASSPSRRWFSERLNSPFSASPTTCCASTIRGHSGTGARASMQRTSTPAVPFPTCS